VEVCIRPVYYCIRTYSSLSSQQLLQQRLVKSIANLCSNNKTSAEPAGKFEITNKVAYLLRSPRLQSVYNDILQQDHLPFFRGVIYYYTRYKLACMDILICVVVTLLDYLKAREK
ncbi:hypothetical protein INT47_005902, partial [Mucor saturninus]